VSQKISIAPQFRFCYETRPAMSNPYGSLSQKLCHYLNQGRTSNDMLMRAAD